MRNPISVHVDEIVVHILEPKGREFVPSGRPIDLRDEDRLRKYFVDHITDSLAASITRAARFKHTEDKATPGICNAILTGATDLVAGSQALAQSLYTILENDQRIAPGDLAVCLYQADNYGGRSFLALLKINPSEVYQRRVVTDDGDQYVEYRLADESLFAKGEPLQKAAFVQLRSEDEDYDLLMLDRQTRGIADFFARDFLDVEEAFDASQRTIALFRALMQAHNEVRAIISPDQNNAFDAAVTAVFDSDDVDVDAFVKGLALPDEAKRAVRAHLDASLPDQAFALDRDVVGKILRTRRFGGDHGLRVEVRRDAFEDVIQSVAHVENDPQRPQGYYRIVIHTERWEELR